MNWQAIGAVAEAIAALGVILSLIYVGAQVRHSMLETRVGILRSVVNELGRVHDSLAHHADLADIAVRGFADYQSLSVVERARLSSYLAHMFKLFEQLYVLHRSGSIQPEDWQGFEHAIGEIAAYPGVQRWWETRSHWMRADFATFVRDAAARVAAANIYLETPESEVPAAG